MALPAAGYDTYDLTLPSAALTDVPLIIDLGSRASASFWSDCNTDDGTRGRVALNDGTEIASHWDSDFDYSANTGWVRFKVASVPDSGSLTIRVYSPNTRNTAYAVDDTYGSENAYNSDIEHYSEDAGGTDATSNGADIAVISAGNPTPGGATGQIGAATTYDNINDYLQDATGSPVSAYPVTIMALVKPTDVSASANDSIVVISDGSTDNYIWAKSDGGNASLVYKTNGLTYTSDISGMTTGWQHVAFRLTSSDVQVFRNGTGGTADSHSESYPTMLKINVGNFTNIAHLLGGDLQHLFIASADLGADWIQLESDMLLDQANTWTAGSWSSPDSTPPTVSSLTIDKSTLTIVYDENVTATDASGFSLTMSGGSGTLSGLSGDGTDTHTYTVSRTVDWDEAVTLTYDSGTGSAVDDASNALASFTDSSVTNVSRPLSRPTYAGHPWVNNLTAISPKITIHRNSSGYIPHFVHVSARETTFTADSGFDPYVDLHFAWDFGDSGGSETATDWFTEEPANANDEQTGGEAVYCYRSSGSYTITLTASGKDQYGQTISASTTTLLTLGEYEFFRGGATGGTFTITVDGQTTSAIDYDATEPEVETAIAALSTVGSGNVRATGAGTYEFCGALAGSSLTVTANYGSLTGAGAGDAAPQTLERQAPSSASSITVNDLSTHTEVHFDSNAAGGGDGSFATPYNDASTLQSTLDGSSSTVTKQHVKIKAGSDFTMTDAWYLNPGDNHNRVSAYGTGAAPILRDTGSGATYATFFEGITGRGGSSPLTKLEDFVISGIDFEGEQSLEMFFVSGLTNGAAGTPFSHQSDIYWDNCTLTRVGGGGYLIRTQSLGGTFMRGFGVWNCDLDMGAYSGVCMYSPKCAAWSFMVGGSLAGMDADVSPLLKHQVYPKTNHHSLYRWIEGKEATESNYVLGLDAGRYDDGTAGLANECHVIDGCKVYGTTNGIEFSNVENAYGNYGWFNRCVVQFCTIDPGAITVSGQDNGIVIYTMKNAAIRHNDFVNGDDTNIYSVDTTSTLRIYYNRSYGLQPLVRLNNDDGYLFGNKSQTTSANAALEYDTSDCDVTSWEIDGNTWYAPSASGIVEETDASTYYSLATWQSTFGHDTNGANEDPGFSDPTNGVMEYDWATPSYEASSSSVTPKMNISNDAASLAAYIQQYGIPAPQLDITPHHPGVVIDTSGISQPGIMPNG